MPTEKLLSIIEKAIRKTLVVSNIESFHFTAEEIIKNLEKIK